jgi:hypothetical protein
MFAALDYVGVPSKRNMVPIAAGDLGDLHIRNIVEAYGG